MNNIYWVVFTYSKPWIKIKNFVILRKKTIISTEVNMGEVDITSITHIAAINTELNKLGYKDCTCFNYKFLRKE